MGGMNFPAQLLRPAEAGRSALYYLEQTDSTNTWARRQMQQLGDLDAVFSTNQTAGRGRLGRTWENARGLGLYYSIVIRRPLAQPAALPLLASVAVQWVLKTMYGADCRIKWPNDLLLNSRKLCGILCEGVPGGIVCGVGINLAQTRDFFDKAELPYATSILAESGRMPDLARDPAVLAAKITDEGFAPLMDRFAAEGFSAIADGYTASCVNLGRPVQFDGGTGTAVALDGEGRLVVETDGCRTAVFTGEVSVQGIYGHL